MVTPIANPSVDEQDYRCFIRMPMDYLRTINSRLYLLSGILVLQCDAKSFRITSGAPNPPYGRLCITSISDSSFLSDTCVDTKIIMQWKEDCDTLSRQPVKVCFTDRIFHECSRLGTIQKPIKICVHPEKPVMIRLQLVDDCVSVYYFEPLHCPVS